MKNLNDFINRANQTKSRLRQTTQEGTFVDTSTNDRIAENIDEGYNTYMDTMEEDLTEEPVDKIENTLNIKKLK